MKVLIFTYLVSFFLISCSSNVDFNIHISERYTGPVLLIYKKKSGVEKYEASFYIDTLGLCKTYIPINYDGINIKIRNDENEAYEYAPNNKNEISNNERMIFDFGNVLSGGDCEGNSEMEFIYFYVGTNSQYKDFISKNGRDEFEFFEKKNIDICEFSNW